jgi:tetratricopeptide (TPR) repeat protein
VPDPAATRQTRRAARIALAAAALAALLAHGCASTPPAAPRDHFPLDPREGLTGPFDPAIEDGWQALLAGDATRAGKEFARPTSGPSARAAAIGQIEVLVARGRSSEALAACETALAKPDVTLALDVGCGEAQARAGSPIEAYQLYARAAALAPDRPGLAARAQKLLAEATDETLAQADRDAALRKFDAARAGVARAVAWNPRSAAVLVRAAGVECEAGEKERALQYDREALALGGLDADTRAGIGRLALEVGDDAMAVSVFDALAAEDPRFSDQAAEARLAFRMSNWPESERQAARARRLTRAGAASLVWWMFPEVRDARVTGSVVATDVLERRDSRPMMKAVALGLLDVDVDTHRARPDAVLSRAAAAQMLLRLAGVLRGSGPGLPCLRGSPGPWRGSTDAIRLAAACGLLSESGGSVVSGHEFTRALDRLRSLLQAGEGKTS